MWTFGRSLRDLVVPTAILLYLGWLEHFESTSARLAGGDISGPRVSVPKTLRWALVFDDASALYRGKYEERWRQFTRPDRLKTVGTAQVIISTA